MVPDKLKTFLTREGNLLPDKRTHLDVIDVVFRIIGGIFAVCFPLVVMLLWTMSRDIHSISEQMATISANQANVSKEINTIQQGMARHETDLGVVKERLVHVETELNDHKMQDRTVLHKLKRGESL